MTLGGHPSIHNEASGKPLCSKPDEQHSVRCCINSKDGQGKVQMNEYGCNKNKVFAEAADICDGNGFRLCTVKEIKDCKTCGTGCGYDTHRIWSSDGDNAAAEKKKAEELKAAAEKVAAAQEETKKADEKAAQEETKKADEKAAQEEKKKADEKAAQEETKKAAEEEKKREEKAAEEESKAAKRIAAQKKAAAAATCRMTLGGGPSASEASGKTLCSKPDEQHSVRCCSKDGQEKVQMKEYGCNKNKVFAKAAEICDGKGFRLCTVKEIKACKTCGTGCGYDTHRIWSSDGGDKKALR
jgi:hypothetical protein